MNTAFEYQYRDAQNYKVWNEVILTGELNIDDLQPYLFDGEFFVPSEVGLEDLQEMPFADYDHIWHEIIKISPTTKTKTVNIASNKLITLFKDAKASNWNQNKVFERKGLV